MAAVAFCLSSVASLEASWRGVADGNGYTWARIKFVNLSANDTAWILSNCRAAISSTESAADTDASSDWSGTVPAGAQVYVWVFGYEGIDATVASAGGTESGYNASAQPDAGGDGEWVITIAADGNVTGAIEPASYGLPSQTGTMPVQEIQE